jgi:hypothetical protein
MQLTLLIRAAPRTPRFPAAAALRSSCRRFRVSGLGLRQQRATSMKGRPLGASQHTYMVLPACTAGWDNTAADRPGAALHVGWQLRLVAGQAVQRQVALQRVLNAGRQHLQCSVACCECALNPTFVLCSLAAYVAMA